MKLEIVPLNILLLNELKKKIFRVVFFKKTNQIKNKMK